MVAIVLHAGASPQNNIILYVPASMALAAQGQATALGQANTAPTAALPASANANARGSGYPTGASALSGRGLGASLGQWRSGRDHGVNLPLPDRRRRLGALCGHRRSEGARTDRGP